MPLLPSGRRVEFSLDRFHALLKSMSDAEARGVVEHMTHPDDLLYVLDAVHFSLADGSPYFAGYVAADWRRCAADWNGADRQALQAWLASAEARAARSEAIRYIKSLLFGGASSRVPYPYVIACDFGRAGMMSAPRMRQ